MNPKDIYLFGKYNRGEKKGNRQQATGNSGL
jgi:hypothetical protein